MDVAGSDAAVGMAPQEHPHKTYDALISYAHGADREFAPALHQGLQRLAKPWNRRRATEVFRRFRTGTRCTARSAATRPGTGSCEPPAFG